MDEIERKEQLEQFRIWALEQESDQYRLYEKEQEGAPNSIVLETDDAIGEVCFYPLEIIQLSVLNRHIDRHVFFLHFQINTLEHAQGLFREMVDTILELGKQPSAKILLCCSSALTTGYFAEKLNETVKTTNLNYSFHAVSYNMLYQEAGKYDMILLAPQIAYVYEQAKKILAHRFVLKIPPRIFGTYNVMALLDFIHPYLESRRQDKDTDRISLFEDPAKDKGIRHKTKQVSPSDPVLPLRQDIRIDNTTLAIALIHENDDQYHFASRIYDKSQNILYDVDQLKPKIVAEDLYDICDTALARFPEVQTIGIAMPGIINNGRVSLGTTFQNLDVVGMLKERYGREVYLENDANSIVAGYYATQTKYSSISLLFQPSIVAYDGVGSIYNGHLIEGHCHVAGEVKYLPSVRRAEKELIRCTPEGALAIATETMAALVCILGPELIILSSHLILSADRIRQELGKYIPMEYLPDVLIIRNVREYMLLGMVIACSLKEQNMRKM
jgi:cellobiose-specific phosphotransferase system component IIB